MMTPLSTLSKEREAETTDVAPVSKAIGFFFKPAVRSGWTALLNQGVVSVSNFLTGVIIGRSCSKEEFGLYMLGLSLVLAVTDLQMSLVSTPYMVYSPRFRGCELGLYAGSCLIHQFALSAVVTLGLSAWGLALFLGFGPPGLARVVWALAATVGFIMFKEFARRVCFAGLHMETALLLDFCVALMQVTGLMLLYRLGILSASRAFWAIGFACGIAGAAWLFLNRRAFMPRVSRALSDLGHNWKFGKWIFASGIVWTISVSIYPWFLTAFHGAASAGVWAACLGVVALANVPLMGMQNFLGPKTANIYAQGGAAALYRFVFKSSLLLLIGMAVLCGALLTSGDFLLGLFYGGKYVGNGLIVGILALGLVAGSSAFSFSRALFVVERADMDFKVNFVCLFILLTLGIWLVRTFGPIGAACSFLLSNTAATGVRCAAFVFVVRSGEGK